MGVGRAILKWSGMGRPAPASPAVSASAGSAPGQSSALRTTGYRHRPHGGSGSLLISGMLERFDSNPDVDGPRWYGQPGSVGISRKMMTDGAVRQSIEYITSPIVNAVWKMRPASKDPIDREIADFCAWALLESLPWRHIVRRSIRGYCKDGFHVAELLERESGIPATRFPSHPGRGTAVVPESLRERPAWTVDRWVARKENPEQLASIRQWLRGGDSEAASYVTVPATNLVRWTWDQEGANFQGIAPLRSAYAPWKLKQAFRTIWAIKHERTGVGTPSLTLGEDASEEDIGAAEVILAELRANEKGFLVLPSGYEFTWNNESKGQGSDLEAAINLCNIEIAHNVAAGFMLLGLTGDVGSFALGGTQQGQHHLQTASHADFFVQPWNCGLDGWSPIRRLVDLNYGAGFGAPTLEARNLPTRNWQEVAKTVALLAQNKLITADDATEDELREALQIGPRDPSTARGDLLGLETQQAKGSPE